MSAPLDQRHLSASLQDFERHLLRFHAEVQTGKDQASPSASAPLQWVPEFDAVGNFVATETSAEDNVLPSPADERKKSRRLLLSLAGLVLTLGVGAICLTFASLEDSSTPASTALVKPPADVTAPPPAVQSAVVAPPVVEPPSAPAAPPTAQNVVTPAAPEPKEVQSVSILPDGSLASPDATPPALSAPPAPPSATLVSPAGPSEPVKADARSHRPDTKAAKKPAAAHGAKPVAARAPSTPLSSGPAEATQPAAPADGDGILQNAQRAVGSFTGAMKKLVGGN